MRIWAKLRHLLRKRSKCQCRRNQEMIADLRRKSRTGAPGVQISVGKVSGGGGGHGVWISPNGGGGGAGSRGGRRIQDLRDDGCDPVS